MKMIQPLLKWPWKPIGAVILTVVIIFLAVGVWMLNKITGQQGGVDL